jgi:hypothetical protein
MNDPIRTIVALDGLRLADAYGVLSLIERDERGHFHALRARRESFDQQRFEQFVDERRITPLTRPIDTAIADPVVVYFDSTKVFHSSETPRGSADALWKHFFGAWTTSANRFDVSDRLPGFERRVGLRTERALLMSRSAAHAQSARLATHALAALVGWDANMHGSLQPATTWRLLQWLEFSVAYSGPSCANLGVQLSSWLLAVARTGRVPSVRLDRLDRLVAMDFSADTAAKIRRRADELHERHFSSNTRPRPPQRRAA